jgi:transcriptional regulator with XRE-family HTH domain
VSSTQALIDRIKAELKAAGMTYAGLARALGMAESSIKRMFARGEMPLSRVDEICRVLKTRRSAASSRWSRSVR